MANKQINVTLLLRNDTASLWTSTNPTLGKGEIGIENDTRKFKFGDGTTAWNNLKYSGSGSVEVGTAAPTATDLDYDIGTLWVISSTQKAYLLFAKTETVATWVEIASVNSNVASADKLSTARTFTYSGDIVSASKTFDGTDNVTFSLILNASGVTAGTYTKLTVNSKGVVTSAENVTAADIPDLTLSKISDAGTAASRDIGTASGEIPLLDANGKLSSSVLPAIAITETFVVASQAEMLALTAQQGDVAIRSDESKTYILSANDPKVLDSWVLLKTPASKVLSVNGETGVVTLTTSDIAEGTNLYFTQTRFDTAFEGKSVTDLTDGADVLLSTDTLTFNGGNA